MSKRSNSHSVFTLWYKPGHTTQGLIESGRGHGFAQIMAVSFGLVQAGRFYVANPEIGYACFAQGALAGWLGLYLFAWLLRNFGRWFGGQANQREVRVALGWGIFPWLLLFFALVFVLRSAVDVANLADHYWLFFLGFLYGYVVLLLSIAAALRLSILKTFLCLIVTCLVSIFPLTLIIQMLASLA